MYELTWEVISDDNKNWKNTQYCIAFASFCNQVPKLVSMYLNQDFKNGKKLEKPKFKMNKTAFYVKLQVLTRVANQKINFLSKVYST